MISRKSLSFSSSLLFFIVIGIVTSCARPTLTPSPTVTPISTPTVTLLPSSTPTPAPVSQSMDADGGTITLANAAKLTVPTGAVEGSGEITIEPLEMPEDKFLPPIAGPIYRITLQDAKLAAPVQISIPLPEGITPEEFEVAIYHYSEDQPVFVDLDLEVDLPPLWTPLPSTVSDGYVSAWVDSFSLFSPGWFWKGEEASMGINVDRYYTGGDLKVSVNGSYCFKQSTFHVDPMVDTEATMFLMLDTSWGAGHFFHAPVMDKKLADVTESYSLDFEGIAEEGTPQRCHPASHTFKVPLQDYIDENNTSVKLYVMFESETTWFEYPLRKQFFSPMYNVYIANRASVRVDPPSGRPGDRIGVFGEGFKAGEEVNLIWDLESEAEPEFATVTIDKHGRFVEYVNVPPDARPHTFGEVIAKGRDSERTTSAKLAVLKLVEPYPAEQVATLDVEGTTVVRSEVENYAGEDLTWHIYDQQGETELMRRANDEYRVDLSEYHLSSGKYTVVLEMEDPQSEETIIISNKVAVTISSSPAPVECLTLTPVGGDTARRVVLSRRVEEPVTVQFEVKDRCGRADSTDWKIVNYLGDIATLALHEGPLLTVKLHPGVYEPGTYNGAVGIHYPGCAFPELVEIQVTVTKQDFVLPQDFYCVGRHTSTYTEDGEVYNTCVTEARRKVSEVVNGQYALIAGEATQECTDGDSDETTWKEWIDLFSGRELGHTPPSAGWYHVVHFQGPRPGAGTEYIEVSGQTLKVFVIEEERSSAVGDGWVWKDTLNREIYDEVTGVWVGEEVSSVAYQNGQRSAYRMERRQVEVETNIPLGEQPQEKAEAETCNTQHVPNVVGMSLSEAGEFLSNLGYGYTWKDEHLDDEDVGLIVDQAPEPDTCHAPQFTVVVLTRNLGR